MSDFKKTIESNIGAILSALIISFVTGTIAMIYKSDRTSEIFVVEMRHMTEKVAEIKSDIFSMKTGIKDRWTKQDHRAFEIAIKHRINKIEDRLHEVEQSIK